MINEGPEDLGTGFALEGNADQNQERSINMQDERAEEKADEPSDEQTIEQAREAEREGKSPSTQAGEFVREEIHHIREGKHGARSTKQAIAIGLSKARRAGVKLKPPKKGKVSSKTRESAQRDYQEGQRRESKKPSARRSRAITRALKREGRQAASSKSLSRQARTSSRRRSASARSVSARKAARTRAKSRK
jgi:hypothetical protein